jgi:hypothetical protein
VNVDRILQASNEAGVEYLLIGGMNFLLRHKPVRTFDVGLWIRDEEANRARRRLARSPGRLLPDESPRARGCVPRRAHVAGGPGGQTGVMTDSQLKDAEERKRDRAWNPAERWRLIKETIAWAEAQLTTRRNTPARRIQNERRLLAGLRGWR